MVGPEKLYRKPLKFSRDLDSEWSVKNDEPHYGLKEHASVEIKNGFILATTLTAAWVVASSIPGKGRRPCALLDDGV